MSGLSRARQALAQCAEQRAETVRHSNEDTTLENRRQTRYWCEPRGPDDRPEGSARPGIFERCLLIREVSSVCDSRSTAVRGSHSHARRKEYEELASLLSAWLSRSRCRSPLTHRPSHRHLCPPASRCQRRTRRSSWVTPSAHRTTFASPRSPSVKSSGRCLRRRPHCSTNRGDQLITHFFSPNPAEGGVAIRATWQDSRDTSSLMIPGIVEKLGHVAGVAVLYGQRRLSVADATAAGPDLLLAVLFIAAFAKTPKLRSTPVAISLRRIRAATTLQRPTFCDGSRSCRREPRGPDETARKSSRLFGIFDRASRLNGVLKRLRFP